MDCVKDKNQDLCQQEAVKAYPTFHYYHYGKFVEKYESDRTVSGVGPKAAIAEGRQEPQQSAQTLCADRITGYVITLLGALGGHATTNRVSLWVCIGVGGLGGTYHSASKSPLFALFFHTLQELGFTSFIRTLREGDLKRLEKRREEL